ncbi:hypothetical protein BDR04DRAFT_102464 [Suillus decipiens]|nr:hypothetical protein BDR04DRAFT_102464 [Suillus decipiens]
MVLIELNLYHPPWSWRSMIIHPLHQRLVLQHTQANYDAVTNQYSPGFFGKARQGKTSCQYNGERRLFRRGKLVYLLLGCLLYCCITGSIVKRLPMEQSPTSRAPLYQARVYSQSEQTSTCMGYMPWSYIL